MAIIRSSPLSTSTAAICPGGAAPAKDGQPLVRIVDDDMSMREALSDLFRSVGRQTRSFGSVQEFLEDDDRERAGCLILDIRLPGTNGLELQAQLSSLDIALPVIIVTGHGDIRMSVQAMKAGALDFFTKPFREQELLDAVSHAIAADHGRRAIAADLRDVQEHFAKLTDRERQVMGLVTTGLRNKQVAGMLGLSEVTIKIHRGSAMRKMEAATLAELVRMAQMLNLTA